MPGILHAEKMSTKQRIYADFNKLDRNRCAILTCMGTQRDLELQGLPLSQGLEARLYMPDDEDENGELDSLEVDAVIQRSEELDCWVGVFEWDELKYRSRMNK